MKTETFKTNNNMKNVKSTRTLVKEVRTQTKIVQMLFDGFWYIIEVLIYNDITNKFEFDRGFGGFKIDAEECYSFETYFL